MPLYRWMQILGVTHFILGALASIGTALALVGIFCVSSVPGPTPQSAEAKFGIEVAALTLGTVAICFVLLLRITFVLGNRLFCRRWHVFCVVMAACEILWGIFPGGIVAFIFFAELSTLQSSSTLATILSAILSAAIPGIPIAVSIATIVLLAMSSTETQ
ncbi:MAG TPA: hypothetical protein VF020_00900 [Chthoniobacterales bacterium]